MTPSCHRVPPLREPSAAGTEGTRDRPGLTDDQVAALLFEPKDQPGEGEGSMEPASAAGAATARMRLGQMYGVACDTDGGGDGCLDLDGVEAQPNPVLDTVRPHHHCVL